MLGDLFNNNRRRDVVTREDQVMRFGKKWRQDKKTGYYVCTTGSRRRLHDVLWEQENIDGIKEIPEGYVVHHIDWNKTHNVIGNLTLITVFGHNLIHNPGKNSGEYTVEIVPGGVSKIIHKHA